MRFRRGTPYRDLIGKPLIDRFWNRAQPIDQYVFEYKGKVLGVQRPIATGAGHHSVVCIPGTDDWYICYHRRPIPSEGRDHRVVCIDKMEFDPGGDIKPVVMTSSGKQEL